MSQQPRVCSKSSLRAPLDTLWYPRGDGFGYQSNGGVVLTKQQQLKSGQALLPCATLRGAGLQTALHPPCD